jgi:hypothetical protein
MGGTESHGIAISGSTAYVAEGDYYSPSCIRIVDVEDPESPRLIGVLNLEEYAHGVTVSGSYACVVGLSSLVILDISKPHDPQIVGTASFPGWGRNGAVFENFVFVAVHYPDTESGLRVFDVTDPTNPVSVSFLPTPCSDVAASEAFVYLVGSSLFRVIDVSDPWNPRLVGETAVPCSTSSVCVVGACAYVAGDAFNLATIDISDPTNPRVLGTLGGQGGYDVAVSGDHAFVAGGVFCVIDVANPGNPPVIGKCEIPGGGRSVAASSGYAYVSSGASFYALTIEQPSEPQIVGTVDTPGGNVEGMDVHGSRAYVAQGDEVRMIDISDPERLSITSAMPIDGGAFGVAATDPLVYVAAGASESPSGLRIVDFSGAEPRLVGAVETPGWPLGIAVSKTHAFLACTDEDDYPWTDSGLWVVDIAVPEDPALVGGLHVEGCYFRDVIFSSGYAHVAGNGGYYLIDVRDPEAPQLVGHVRVGHSGVAVEGTTAYAIHNRMNVVDFANPADPRLVGESMPLATNSITVMNSLVLVACREGLQVLPSHCGLVVSTPRETSASLSPDMQVVPNPTWGPTSFRLNLFKPGSVELRVFDLEGRRVRRLVDEVQHGGWRELAWDGRDENGRRVATGIYFVEMGSPGVTTTRRVAVVR